MYFETPKNCQSSKVFGSKKYSFQLAAANLFTVDCMLLLIFKKHDVVRRQLLCSLFDLKTVQYERKLFKGSKSCWQKDSVNFSNG